MQTTKLKVNWSSSVKIITFMVGVILLIGKCFLIIQLYNDLDILNVSITASTILLLLVVLLGCVLQSPCYIVLTDDKLTLKKLCGTFSIKCSDIKCVENYVYNISDMRKFGSGGFCGYLGVFSNAQIGNYRSFVCNQKQSFLVQTFDGKNYVFSCENKDLIINQFKKTEK